MQRAMSLTCVNIKTWYRWNDLRILLQRSAWWAAHDRITYRSTEVEDRRPPSIMEHQIHKPGSIGEQGFGDVRVFCSP